jgi:two-component system NarL family response regulator
MEKRKTLIADDHALFREGLVGLVNAQEDLVVVGEAGDGLEALEKTRALKPELILMDINMPKYDGLDAAIAIKQEMPHVQVVMLTMLSDDEHLFTAIKGGADGYLLKSISAHEMLESIRAVFRGEVALSPSLATRIAREFAREKQPVAPNASTSPSEALTARELEVLRLAASGASNKEIAKQLSISEHTAKAHMRSILDKLHVQSRAEAAAYVLRKGLFKPQD